MELRCRVCHHCGESFFFFSTHVNHCNHTINTKILILCAKKGPNNREREIMNYLQWLIYIVKFWTCNPPLPGSGPIFFIFMQSSANFGQIIGCPPPSRVGAHHWQILNLQLISLNTIPGRVGVYLPSGFLTFNRLNPTATVPH